MITIEYACPDGTPFPVTFDDDADAEVEWRVDREHAPDSQSPLAEAIGRRFGPGGRRAYEENGMRASSTWRPGPRANGFLYFGTAPPDPDDMASLFDGGAKLIERYGSALAVWEQHCMPRVREACASLESAPVDATFDQLADDYEYALHQTMVAGMISSNDRRLLQESVADAIGGEGDAGALSDMLLHGYATPTLAADAALWRFARQGEGSPGLDEFMERYGGQATTWSVDTPTLHEAPEIVDVQLQLLRRAGTEDPQLAVERAAARRHDVLTDIDARLAGDDAKRARFHRRVERAAALLWIREERALWQLIAVGALRQAVLRRGACLASDGVIADADDVRFLEPAEFDRGTGDLKDAVRERRAAHARWRSVTPPAVVGSGAISAPGLDGRIVRGVAAAPGKVAGTARVIVDLADADRLNTGDVLVCTMTSPPWTPLLAVAAALVTDGGDTLSHAAIAAREYGLPCVVGTAAATALIPDGAHVVVDGDVGLVEVRRG